MQIHELNTFTGNPGDTDYFAVDTGFDTAKISGTDLLKPAKQALDKTNELESFKVNLPINQYNQPDYGSPGDTLRTKGNKETEWAAVGLPTDEQTAQAVQDWLDAHPEATTSVQDHSLTYEKLALGTLGFVIPQMFGAKGDGLTDDTTAFSDCFSGLYQNIFIPKGEYILSNTITIPDDTVVVCAGTITKSGVFDVLFDVGNNCDIQLIIDLDKAAATDFTSQTSADIYLNGKSGTRIHDSVVKNTDSRYAVWVEKCSNLVIENNIVDTYVYSGIGNRDGNDNIKILNNTILNGHGIRTNRYPICLNSSEFGTVSSNILCDGNYIEDTTPAWEAIDAHDLVNAVITNNIMKNTVVGVAVVHENQPSYNVVISGNSYEGPAGLNADVSTFGISCCTGGGSEGIIISNNVLKGCGNNSGTTDKGGIKVYGSENLIIENNIIECADGNGIDAPSISSIPLIDFQIRNNIIDGANVGINLRNGASINISGTIEANIIKNCDTGLSGNEQYGTGYDYVVYAKNNEFINCVTDYINNARGLIVSPSAPISSNYGSVGMELVNIDPSNGRIKSVCTKSGTADDIAEWTPIYHQFYITGDYNSGSGTVFIFDDRVKATSFAVATNVYKSAESIGISLTTETLTGRINVYVRNPDGTPYIGALKLAILVIP